MCWLCMSCPSQSHCFGEPSRSLPGRIVTDSESSCVSHLTLIAPDLGQWSTAFHKDQLAFDCLRDEHSKVSESATQTWTSATWPSSFKPPRLEALTHCFWHLKSGTENCYLGRMPTLLSLSLLNIFCICVNFWRQKIYISPSHCWMDIIMSPV